MSERERIQVTPEQLGRLHDLKGVTTQIHRELLDLWDRLKFAAEGWDELAAEDGDAVGWEETADSIREAMQLVDDARTIIEEQSLA